MPKVLVTGASGLLGRAVVALLKEEEGWHVVGLAYTRISDGLIKCDLRDEQAVSAIFKKEKPNLIIHCAVERNPFKCENHYDETVQLNVTATGHLAAIAKEINSKIIYISTDYVFDGKEPPFKVDDEYNPLNKYGQSKLDGEKTALKANPDVYILRVPVMYGPVERIDESAVTTILKFVKSKEPIKVSHYEKRYPVHVNDIARILRDLIKKVEKDSTIKGIFQWSGKERMTKYEMAKVISEIFHLKFDHVIPDSTAVLQRPYDCQLDTSRLEKLGISHHTPFRDGIKSCLDRKDFLE